MNQDLYLDYHHRDLKEHQRLLISNIRALMERYDDKYWLEVDAGERFPEEFVREYLELGLAGLMIPEEYGGAGYGVQEAALVMEEISACGGTAYHVRAMYYPIDIIVKHGSKQLKEKYLPGIARGELRLFAFAVTEPEAGSDTARISTYAKREGDKYIINGRKIFISRVRESDLMFLVARTSPYNPERRYDGISLFLVDLREARGIEARKIKVMALGPVYELAIENLEVPAENLVGEEGRGFRHLLGALNAERIVIAGELVGATRYLLKRAVEYASKRIVFGKPIGSYQGVQFPISSTYIELLAADEILHRAAKLYDEGAESRIVGLYTNAAKYYATEVAWKAANTAMDTFGGYGYAWETGIERKLREIRLYKVAPINQNLILAYIGHSILGLPRSYEP
ncbi:MAG: acyl-CoA dehydrogenase family protein [Sulfolobales archaeon]